MTKFDIVLVSSDDMINRGLVSPVIPIIVVLCISTDACKYLIDVLAKIKV